MDPELHIWYLAQDDKRKNTAVKLARRDLVNLHDHARTLPRAGVLLDPLCGKVLGPEDHELLTRPGGTLVGFDCSWKHIHSSLDAIDARTKRQKALVHRTLPLLLAANPVSWGKPGRLTTAEALAATLCLIGQRDRAQTLLAAFKWGQRFLELNHEPLEAYAAAVSSEALIQLQFDFFD